MATCRVGLLSNLGGFRGMRFLLKGGQGEFVPSTD